MAEVLRVLLRDPVGLVVGVALAVLWGWCAWAIMNP